MTNLIYYIKDNFSLLTKGFLATILLISGPFSSIIMKWLITNEYIIGNWVLILLLGFIIEIFGVIGFLLLIRKDYLNMEEEVEEPSSKKKRRTK